MCHKYPTDIIYVQRHYAHNVLQLILLLLNPEASRHPFPLSYTARYPYEVPEDKTHFVYSNQCFCPVCFKIVPQTVLF